MQPDLLVKALVAIEPKTTFEKFREASGIASRSVAKSVLAFLSSNNVGKITKNTIEFSGSDRIYAAMLALQMGCDIELVSGRLTWKDFEKLASEVLASFGYRTQTNVQLTKPRMEIDVVGVSSEFAIVVDCKHWKRSNLSSISGFSKKQAVRAERLLKWDAEISHAVPVIMTLHAESVKFVGGVPVVPVHKFRSFVMDVKGFLPEIYVAG
jgi:restriction endonuclease